MITTQHLPDAMPEIKKRTLLLVCDTYHARFITVGEHTLMVHSELESPKDTYSDAEGRVQSPAAFGKGGLVSSTAEPEQVEQNRLKHFANQVIAHLNTVVHDQKIEDAYISAPHKFLAALKKDLPKGLMGVVKEMKDGNFAKERLKDVLLRFRPDLEIAVQALRDEENYSPKKHLPK